MGPHVLDCDAMRCSGAAQVARLQDNVREFPAEFPREMLSGLYEMPAGIIDPMEMGWPVVRRRQYIVGRHLRKPVGFHTPFQMFPMSLEGSPLTT